ncbi:copper resistance protein NlpE N-terminal domain-containing protein [Nibrella saemangeumensis]|uniref:Copper resistance protein NlpE N-terminal domain-containing protein n=1 Tax=Nibrella saemangeumensis TaxID=1084526 RepID=A0ABP8M9U6_9BACT
MRQPIIVITLVILAACARTKPAPAVTGGPVISTDTGAPPVNRVVYEGLLPCPKCKGIQTELTLNINPNNPRQSYQLKQVYLGTSKGDRTYTKQGTYITLRGTATDNEAMVIQLDPNKSREIKNYLRIHDDTLRLLDRQKRLLSTTEPTWLIRKHPESGN